MYGERGGKWHRVRSAPISVVRARLAASTGRHTPSLPSARAGSAAFCSDLEPPLLLSHDLVGVVAPPQETSHGLHRLVDMHEEGLVSLAQIVQPGFPCGRRNEPVPLCSSTRALPQVGEVMQALCCPIQLPSATSKVVT